MNHLSDLQLDRLLTGELAVAVARTARDHARTCAACGKRLREVTADRAVFAHRPLPSALRPPRWMVPLALAAAAAGALVVVRNPEAPALRAKGDGPALVLAAGRPDALDALTAGDRIHPGDYLQAGYSAGVDGFGAVVSRDGAGGVMVYVPAGGAEMVALPAGTDRSFPQSTLLDGVTGGERVLVVWCDAPHPLAPLLGALRAGAPPPVLAGCTIRDTALVKEAP